MGKFNYRRYFCREGQTAVSQSNIHDIWVISVSTYTLLWLDIIGLYIQYTHNDLRWILLCAVLSISKWRPKKQSFRRSLYSLNGIYCSVNASPGLCVRKNLSLKNWKTIFFSRNPAITRPKDCFWTPVSSVNKAKKQT